MDCMAENYVQYMAENEKHKIVGTVDYIMLQTNLQLKQFNCACFYWRKMKHFNTAVIKCSLYLLRKRYLT